MNSTKIIYKAIIRTGLGVAMILLISNIGFTQDSTKTKGGKKVKIVKVTVDDNGKKQVLDTTIILDHNMKPGEEAQIMKGLELQYKELGDQMRDMEIQMSEINLPDSSMMDSIQKLTEKCMGVCKGFGDRPCCKGRNPHMFRYNFDFDMPDIGDFPRQRMEDFDDLDIPGFSYNRHMPMVKGEGSTLNDVLGDIPMDRVKSYTIKDTKDGKKIVIELKNGPLVEHRNEVIILRDGGHMNRGERGRNPHMEKRIIIKSGDDDKTEKSDKL